MDFHLQLRTHAGRTKLAFGHFHLSLLGSVAHFAVAAGADEQVLKANLITAAAMSAQSHYGFLGVPKTADDSAIRAAYVALARDYHPDRIAGSSLARDPDVLAAVDLLFRRLGDANKAICTADGRARY